MPTTRPAVDAPGSPTRRAGATAPCTSRTRDVGRDRDRVAQHARFVALDARHLGRLLLGREVLVDDADAAFLRDGDRQARLGHGVHRRRHERQVQADVAATDGSRGRCRGATPGRYAGTNNTSSKVSALPRRRMRKAPDAKANYTDGGAVAGPARTATDVTPHAARIAVSSRGSAPGAPLHCAAMTRPLSAPVARPVQCCCWPACAVAPSALAQAHWKWRDKERPDPCQRPAAAARNSPTRTSCSARAPRASPRRRPAPRAARSALGAGSAAPASSAGDSKLADEGRGASRTRPQADEKARRKAIEEPTPPSRPTTASAREAQLATLESGLRIARINDKGEREFLDDKAARRRSASARAESPPTASEASRARSPRGACLAAARRRGCWR